MKVEWPSWLRFKPDPEGNNIANKANEVIVRKGLGDVDRTKMAADHDHGCGCIQCQHLFEQAEDQMDWIMQIGRWNTKIVKSEGKRIEVSDEKTNQDDDDGPEEVIA